MTRMTQVLAGLAVVAWLAPCTPAQMQEDPAEILQRIVKTMNAVDRALSQASTAQTSEQIDQIIEDIEKLLDLPPSAGGGGGGGGGGGQSGESGESSGLEGTSEAMGEASSQIDRLLEGACSGAQSAVDEIDRLLEMARQMSSGACEECKKGTCTKPEHQMGQQDQEQAPKPESLGQDDPSDGAENPAQEPYDPEKKDPPDSQTEQNPPPDDDEIWGLLPMKIREMVEKKKFDKIPPRWRMFVEMYYNSTGKRDR